MDFLFENEDDRKVSTEYYLIIKVKNKIIFIKKYK